MIVASIRFSDQVYQKAKEMAKFSGISISTYVRNAVEEKIEDQEDYDDCVRLDNRLKDTVTRDKVIKETFLSKNG